LSKRVFSAGGFILLLAACGGSSGSLGSDGGSSPIEPNPPAGASLATGSITSATASRPGALDPILAGPNNIAPQTITFVGSATPRDVGYNAELTLISSNGRLFSFMEGADARSFALIGIPNNNAGSFIYGASPAPDTGSTTYNGRYFGRHNGGGTFNNPFVEGNITLTADFDRNLFSGRISDRTVVVGDSNINAATFREDVSFSGSVSPIGVMRGSNNDSNSSGDVNAIAFGSGVVGTVDILHDEGRSELFPGAGTCGFGSFASCIIRETGVFSAD